MKWRSFTTTSLQLHSRCLVLSNNCVELKKCINANNYSIRGVYCSKALSFCSIIIVWQPCLMQKVICCEHTCVKYTFLSSNWSPRQVCLLVRFIYLMGCIVFVFAQDLLTEGLNVSLRSQSRKISADTHIYVVDTLGLYLREFSFLTSFCSPLNFQKAC